MARIAVVDDLDFNRELIKALLGPAGHEVVEAADGAVALELVRTQRPALIVCDVLMPVMDGYEFVRRLRTDAACGDYGARVPVIFWSAYYNEDEALRLAAECGVHLLLPKPCAPERMLKAILQALDTHAPPAPASADTEFEGQHRRLLTDKLSAQTTALLRANARLTALFGLVLALGNERDPQRLLAAACLGARELLGASAAWLVYREHDAAPVRTVSEGPHASLPAPHGGCAPDDDPPDARFGATLMAPLSSARASRGWLMIARLPGEPPFDEDDEHLLGLLAAQTLHAWEIERLNVQLTSHAAALEDEITERERITAQLDVQYAIARQLAGAQNVDAVLPVLLRTLGERLGFEIAALWLPDPRAGGLRCEQVWATPASAHLGCAAARVLRRLPAGHGQPERSRRQRRPLWGLDLHLDEDTGRDADCPGLHACATLPVPAGERIVAVFELLATERRPPDPGLLDLLWAIGEQIGQFWARIEQQQRNARLARVHAVLSGINGALVRIHERAALLRATCRIAVEQGEFGIAWIGDYDAAAERVSPVAWAGIDDGFGAQALAIGPGSDEDFAALIVREAVRRREAVWCNDLAAESALAHSRFAEAQRRGFGSIIVLPLVVEQHIGGVLVLYTQAPDYFTREERELLEQVASDIAFGLADIDRRDRLDYLNHFDPLTGLPNRTLWRERLGHTLIENGRHRERTAVVVIDIARFRHVNNGFGRSAGDALLRALAERTAAVWPEPSHVGRLGADCFAGILPRFTDPQQLTQLLEGRLSAAVSAPFPVEGHELRPDFVAGIAIAPDDGNDADSLLHHAEAALAQAKAAERPYVFYRPELTTGIAGTLRLEYRMHRALERGELELHYQPRADARSGRLTGLEALMRWRDPENGLVAPLRFIPVLERLGLINLAGEWTIRQALADSRHWSAIAGPLRVAVNVSSVQLREPGFEAAVLAALAAAPADGAPLDLEITETVLMSRVEQHGLTLAGLRRHDVGIAIDDFGTGYSSLAYLARLPVDALKIDRSFIETLTERPESLAIVRTVISLAQALRLKTVAEGVETAEQAQVLAGLGCDELQGYWISRPLPLDALLDWLCTHATTGV